jgi:phosphoribosylformylglycinamidine cyclo-ligase
MPLELTATIDRATWTPAPVFDLVRRVGDVPLEDLEMTLNCGVGMVAVVAPDAADRAIEVLAGHDVRAWVAGEIAAATGGTGGTVSLAGAHPGW